MFCYITRFLYGRTDHEHEQRILLHKPRRWLQLHPIPLCPILPKRKYLKIAADLMLLVAEDGLRLRGDISRGLLCPWSSYIIGIQRCKTRSMALFEPAGCPTVPLP